MLREREYMEAAALLKTKQHYEPVMRLCVFNELPAFLSARLQAQALARPELAQTLIKRHHLLLEGLSTLEMHWRPHSAASKQNSDIP